MSRFEAIFESENQEYSSAENFIGENSHATVPRSTKNTQLYYGTTVIKMSQQNSMFLKYENFKSVFVFTKLNTKLYLMYREGKCVLVWPGYRQCLRLQDYPHPVVQRPRHPQIEPLPSKLLVSSLFLFIYFLYM